MYITVRVCQARSESGVKVIQFVVVLCLTHAAYSNQISAVVILIQYMYPMCNYDGIKALCWIVLD